VSQRPAQRRLHGPWQQLGPAVAEDAEPDQPTSPKPANLGGEAIVSALEPCTRGQGGVAPCDIRLAGRHEVPVLRNTVCGRGEGAREPISARARSLVRGQQDERTLALLRGAR
jgi:hypothetical protein